MSAEFLPLVTLSPNGAVFDLPIYVAQEHGLFEKAGIRIAFAQPFTDNDNTAKNPFARTKEALYEQGKADAYNLCEWAGLDRSERSNRGSQVLALRPAVAAQAIITFDPEIQEPRDLAGVAIGINEVTGSHYTTLQLLEGTIPREDIIVEHLGAPSVRYEALKAGKARAIAIMEPFISLALKEGAHIVAVNFYRGAEVISPDLPEAHRQAYLEAINQASDLINQDFGRYKHYVVKQLDGKLAPEELHNHFVHYAHSKPLDPSRFEYTYSWMQSWNLTPGANTHAALVVQ